MDRREMLGAIAAAAGASLAIPSVTKDQESAQDRAARINGDLLQKMLNHDGRITVGTAVMLWEDAEGKRLWLRTPDGMDMPIVDVDSVTVRLPLSGRTFKLTVQ